MERHNLTSGVDEIKILILALFTLVCCLLYIGETNKNNPVEVGCAK